MQLDPGQKVETKKEAPMASLVRFFIAAGFVACTAGVAQAAPCIQESLNNYLSSSNPSFSCTVNDKTFSGFTYVNTVTGGAVATLATGVIVVPLPVPVLTPLALPGPSLEFTDSWHAGVNQSNDIAISFNVTAGSGFKIDDVSGALTGGVTGNGTILLDKTLTSTSPPFVDGPLQGCIPNLVGCTAGFVDQLLTTPTVSLHVLDDTILTGNNGTADLSIIDNQFSQIGVPEPTTLALLGVGLLGLRMVRRRRRA
jgi:hypothetical protein